MPAVGRPAGRGIDLVSGRTSQLPKAAAATLYDGDAEVLVSMVDEDHVLGIRRPVGVGHCTIVGKDLLHITAIDGCGVESSHVGGRSHESDSCAIR